MSAKDEQYTLSVERMLLYVELLENALKARDGRPNLIKAAAYQIIDERRAAQKPRKLTRKAKGTRRAK